LERTPRSLQGGKRKGFELKDIERDGKVQLRDSGGIAYTGIVCLSVTNATSKSE